MLSLVLLAVLVVILIIAILLAVLVLAVILIVAVLLTILLAVLVIHGCVLLSRVVRGYCVPVRASLCNEKNKKIVLDKWKMVCYTHRGKTKQVGRIRLTPSKANGSKW